MSRRFAPGRGPWLRRFTKTRKLGNPQTEYPTSTFDTIPAFFNQNSGAVSVSNGRGVLPCTSTYTEFSTAQRYNLTGSSLTVQVVSQPGEIGTREFFVQLITDASNAIYIFDSGGVFAARLRQGGTNTDVNLGAYSTTTHAWWRIRESVGTIFWDFSPDGLTWTNATSRSYTLNITALEIAISCGYFGTETSPPDALIDNLNTPPIVPIAEGGTSTLGIAGTGSQTSVEFTRTPNPVTVTRPTSIWPWQRRPNAQLVVKAPPVVADVRAQTGQIDIGLAGTAQQTSVEFTQQWRQQITPPRTDHPAWRRPNVRLTVDALGPVLPEAGTATVGLAATGQAVKVAPQGGTSALGLAGTGQQTSVAFTRAIPVYVTAPSSIYPSRRQVNAQLVLKAPPPIQVAAQTGTCALGLATTGTDKKLAVETGASAVGLAGTGQQTSVEFTRTPNPVVVLPGRTYPRVLLTPNQRQTIKAPLPPPTATAENGTAALGLAATATPVKKIAAVAGTCGLGLAATGTAKRTAAEAGTAALGLASSGTAKAVKPQAGTGALGVAETGLSLKRNVQLGRACLGLIGRYSSTPSRNVTGATTLLLLPRFDPIAQLPKPLHGGTSTDLATRRHAGTNTDAATRYTTDEITNVASPDHAGTSTDAATRYIGGAITDVAGHVSAGHPSN